MKSLFYILVINIQSGSEIIKVLHQLLHFLGGRSRHVARVAIASRRVGDQIRARGVHVADDYVTIKVHRHNIKS